MKIAIEGCAHGDLNKIYESILYIQEREKIKVDLLICCGDFQSVRNKDDMLSMAVPPKYREMKDFHEYYNGAKKAPILTLFIGGNHESANYLWELPYGGWVAENIYYLGYAGVINFAGLKIGGLTGIFKLQDYGKSHFERPPFDESSKRSFYHVRSSDVAKLKLLSGLPFDIFLSHDWPRNIYNYGDAQQLIRFKPFFRDEIESGTLGSNAAEDLLHSLKPTYWFSAHLHAKFSALVPHEGGQLTKFLALDKCLPRRNFLQIIDIEKTTEDHSLYYDPYWLCVLKATEQTACKRSFCSELPANLKPTEFDVEKFLEGNPDLSVEPFQRSPPGVNPQTEEFCERFNIVNPCISTTIDSKRSTFQQSTPGKINLPKPKLNLPKPTRDSFETVLKPEVVSTSDASTHEDVDNDEFAELKNPNFSSNPDEIEISDGDDDDGDDDDDDDVKSDSDNGQTEVKNKILENSFSSFIETPARHRNQTSTDSGSNNSFESNTPLKKQKLIRRNQNLYTPSKDESSS